MFTGIVEELGEVVELDWNGDGRCSTVRGPTWSPPTPGTATRSRSTASA